MTIITVFTIKPFCLRAFLVDNKKPACCLDWFPTGRLKWLWILKFLYGVIFVFAIKRNFYLFELPAQENLLEYLKRDFAVSRPSLSCSQVRQKVVAILLHVSVIVLFLGQRDDISHIMVFTDTLLFSSFIFM